MILFVNEHLKMVIFYDENDSIFLRLVVTPLHPDPSKIQALVLVVDVNWVVDLGPLDRQSTLI